MGAPISREEFNERLASLCLGGSSGLPRRARDRHILLASPTLWMEEGTTYTEPEQAARRAAHMSGDDQSTQGG